MITETLYARLFGLRERSFTLLQRRPFRKLPNHRQQSLADLGSAMTSIISGTQPIGAIRLRQEKQA